MKTSIRHFLSVIVQRGPTAGRRLDATLGRLLVTLLVLGGGTLFPQCASAEVAATLQTIHRFTLPDPEGRLVQDASGSFYGVTRGGGRYGYGTIFQIDGNGVCNTLYSFNVAYGAYPQAGLTFGPDGALYGTTRHGGAGSDPQNPTASFGTVFRLDTTGALTVLHDFTGVGDGGNPQAELLLGRDGNFYGTTFSGGPNNDGTVFQISPAGAFSTVAVFSGTNGSHPAAGLIQATDGNFYGTASQGGGNNNGVAFRIIPGGAYSILYNFTSNTSYPAATLVQGPDGAFYGSTLKGGGSRLYGTIFKLTPAGVFTVLHNFTGPGSDDCAPQGPLALASNGLFYGTTAGVATGGTTSGQYAFGYGSVFQIATDGTFTTLNLFNPQAISSHPVANGAYPHAGVIVGPDGNLYGTTSGDYYGRSHLFRMSLTGAYSVVYDFSGRAGFAPGFAGLTSGGDGYFYGVTEAGGYANSGTLFQLEPTGSLNTLHSFDPQTEGSLPVAGLTRGADGYLYGTAYAGGAHSNGSIFRIATDGTFTALHDLDDYNAGEGLGPYATLVQATDGNFYGSTSAGGVIHQYSGTSNSSGALFRITPDGGYTTLYHFATSDGRHPYGKTIQGSDGNIYGVTADGGLYGKGTIFKMDLSGNLDTVHDFNTSDGANPYGGVVQGLDGSYYGTATLGGDNNKGTIFQVTSAGALNTLYSFAGGADGANPYAGLIQAADGNFYGVTVAGSVFQMTPDGSFTTLATLTGCSLESSLLEGGDGYIYGVGQAQTYNVLQFDQGQIFRFTLLPTITSPAADTATTGVPYSYQITATNSPTGISVGTLPAGLSYNAANAMISGTPTAYGTFQIRLLATNAFGTGPTTTLTLVIAEAKPIITSTTSASGTTGAPFLYNITATGNPTSYGANNLPSGLSLNPSTGAITGTPTASGAFSIDLSATNSVGTGMATLNLTINAPPVITSATTATATVGTAFSYQITATSNPASYAASGLPTGLTIDTGAGLISGTPRNAGTAAVTISATNAWGTGATRLTLTIKPVPAITSATTATANVGTAFSYQITATNNPTSYGATGLPTGLTINASSGLITGTPRNTGKAALTISASNANGTGTARLTLTITALPVITSATSASANVGTAFSYQLTATNGPTSYSATGLPTGLTINTSTGLIMGTPKNAGTAAVAISATNANGMGSARLTLTITALPVITSATTAAATVGTAFSYQITATNKPSSYAAPGLPSGLTLDPSTGRISGTPKNAGKAVVTVSATNAQGIGSAKVTITIASR